MSQRFYTTLVTFIIATIVSVAANTSDTLATSVPSPTKAESAATPSAQGENVAGTQHITGTLTDKETKEAVIQATVQLLNAKDSSYVSGTVSNIDGDFSMNVEKPGRYIIKITNIGYKSITRNLTISEGKDFAFGKLNMETDAVLLKEVVANGVAAKVVVKEDTFIYNAAAYHTPEGSVIEELVKRLPGAQIDDDGKITINGKEVKKIMVDGKEFMTGDTQTALKNLPTAIIDKVKAYDEKSDLAKMTGVDDGEEQTVLDFNIKKGMNKGFLANIDLAVGTKSRYAERVMAGYMKDNSRIMVFGNLNNTGDRGFTSGGRGGGGGGNGLQTNKMFGMNYNYEKKDKLKADFSVRWNHGNNDVNSRTATENFVSKVGSFSNSQSQTYSRNNSWNMSGRLEWKPDTMTTLQVRPSFTVSSSDSRSQSENATFNSDPYDLDSNIDPLDEELMESYNKMIYESSGGLDSLLINRRSNTSLSYSSRTQFNINATINRRLTSRGNNLTFQGRYSTSCNDSENLSSQEVTLYRPSTTDSIYHRNRYNVTPSKSWNFQTSLSYTERLSKFSFLVLRYMYRYSNNTSDRSTFDFSKTLYDESGKPVFFPTDFASRLYEMPEYRSFQDYLYPYNPLDANSIFYSRDQSRYSEYDNYTHEVELTWRRTTNKYNLNLGVMVQPQSQRLTYQYLNIDTVAKRSVTNVTPTFDFRYRFNKQKNLRMNYRGYTSQPSMTDLLPITDDTDPLNITKGNPYLKPSFTQNFSLRYNNYIQSHFSSVMAFINYSNTSNSVANMVTYNESTGGRTTQPQNISGAWNVNSAFMYNTSLDTLGRWNVNSFSNVRYNNRPSYVNLDRDDTAEKNYTRTTALSQRLGMSYRTSWLEVELNGQVEYTISKNKLQPDANLSTWHFQYGADITLNAPWGTSLSTGAHMSSRRGYSDASANTNELIWNAQISQSLLAGRPLTISLQFYDILNERSSFSRIIDATSRRDSWYNNINHYAMLHVIYRFNAFGGSAARNGGRGGEGRPEGGPGERGGRGGGQGYGGGGQGFGGGGGMRGGRF